jgi:ribosomal protein L11 methyltransferase
MNYTGVDFEVSPVQPGSDVLIALLAEIGFDSFVQLENGFEAYIPEEQFHAKDLEELGNFDFSYSYKIKTIEQKNWNEEWEKNFHPVLVEDKCCIRASFHDPAHVKLDIIINPKMSFGTGHHDTTWMMSRALFDLDLQNKRLLDMGCGTGVLAIIAHKLGAIAIEGIDIDDWSVENSIENAALNGISDIQFYKGNAASLEGKQFDVILANINRNVLLNDMPVYYNALPAGGSLLLSGFFENDFEELDKKAKATGFAFVRKNARNNWAQLEYRK